MRKQSKAQRIGLIILVVLLSIGLILPSFMTFFY